MSSTFTRIYLQYVCVVKGRENHLQKPWREEVFKYMSGIITANSQKSIIVNGVSDHVHLFVGLKPTMVVSELIRDVKNNSTNFINKNGWLKNKFSWQEGYGAFSYSHSDIETVYNYILNQENHHKKVTFKDEYIGFLNEYAIDYEEQYLFDWLEV